MPLACPGSSAAWSLKRVHARLRRAMAKWCAADTDLGFTRDRLSTWCERCMGPRAGTAFVMWWPSHKSAFIAELRKKNRAFLTAPALAGISSDLMQSQEATDNCRRRPIGLCADAQIRDDGPNMETYHEGTYRSSRVGHADCGPDIRSPGERGSDVPGELLIRL